MKLTGFVFSVFLLFSTSAYSAENSASRGLQEQVITTNVRPDVTISGVLSRVPDDKPQYLAVIFAGYPGVLRVREEAGEIKFELGGNFLVRARRHLASRDIATLMIDCPTDQWATCDDSYRKSETHANDVRQLLKAVFAQTGKLKVVLVGTSYGTVSTAHLSRNLSGEIDGVVHTSFYSAPNANNGVSLSGFDWKAAPVRQLFVQHKDDRCYLTPYKEARSMTEGMQFLTVEGVVNPRGPECKPYAAHGFVGKEELVMHTIADWIRGNPIPEVIQ